MLCLDSLRVSEEDKEPDSAEEWHVGCTLCLGWRKGRGAGLEILGQAVSGSRHLGTMASAGRIVPTGSTNARHTPNAWHGLALLSEETPDREIKAPAVTR